MGFDILALIWGASLLVQLVLLLLVVFSAVSWAIILFKWRELSGATQDSEAFLEIYRRSPPDRAFAEAREFDRSPLAMIFLDAWSDLKPSQQRSAGAQELEAAELRRVSKRLLWGATSEEHRLERGLSFLATTASSAPFIGLFGTVIGIIEAFQAIAASGNASLAVVAPGIAEALVATAVGLLAAIPAAIFYNIFVAQVAEIQSSIELFRVEVTEDLALAGLAVTHSEQPDG